MTAYLPGDWATLVSDEGVVLAATDRLADVATLGTRGLEPLTVVEVLSRGVLSDLPDFAVARIDGDDLRIVVRGAFEVRVGEVVVTGRDAATWNEVTVPLVSGAAVALVGPAMPSSAVALPLAGGVVSSGGLTWTPRGGVAGPASPPPQGAAPPTSQPASQPASPSAPEPVAPAVHEYTAVRTTPPITPPAPPATALPATAPMPTPPRPPAAPLNPPPPPAPPAPPMPAPVWPIDLASDPSPDHDGRTITPAQMQALRAEQAPPSAVPPVVQAVPPTRPSVALQLSTGRVVPVRRRVLIGRSPRVQQVGGSANLPALITVDDPYVSSTHLEVASDGTQVTVTDTSTNGTLLARRGCAPFPLDHGVATEIAVGDVLTLSKGLTATVVPAEAP